MGLETGTYISDLDSDNPVGATDNVDAGDDHIRLLKSTIQATFPNVTGAMTSTHTELNYLDGVTGSTGTGKITLSNGPTFTGTLAATNINASGSVTATGFIGSISAVNVNSGQLADPQVAESNVTQHEAALTLTTSQISDIATGQTFTDLSIGNADTTITRDGPGQLAVEGDAIFSHQGPSYTSAKIHFSTSAPLVSNGSDGDVWFEHEA